MKFYFAILAYVIVSAVLGAGLLMLMAGKPWLLVAGCLVYLIAFARFGCASH
ncbi:MAG TPA: hypothetical protein PKA41_01430 [Verrucomicrobiota bacterium]|nr:hypothetical protein [Verrucomicrobiota bacterium]